MKTKPSPEELRNPCDQTISPRPSTLTNQSNVTPSPGLPADAELPKEGLPSEAELAKEVELSRTQSEPSRTIPNHSEPSRTNFFSSRHFLPCQLKWIDDPSPLKIIQKSRQIGITYADAFDSVCKATPRSADCQSAVSPTVSRPGIPQHTPQ